MTALIAKNAVNDQRFAEAFRTVTQHLAGPQFIYEGEYKIRVWGDMEYGGTPECVRDWLLGNRVITDLKEGLEFTKEATVKRLVKEQTLVEGPLTPGVYWISREGAEKYGLTNKLNCRYPSIAEILKPKKGGNKAA